MSFDLSSLPGPVRFSPPAEMTLHGGEPVPAEMDFFVAPPPEIGPLVSGHSTLKAGKNAMSPGKRLGITGAFAIATLVIGFVAAGLLMPAEPLPIRIVTLFVAAIVGLVAWFTTRFQHTLTYVGQQGVARYLLSGDRSNLPRAEVFPFSEAAELRTSVTNHFHNGVYTGTHFNFTWTNAQGQKRFQIGGQHNARDKMPKPENAYCFAHATEITWSIFLFDYLAAALEQVGFLQFNTKPGEFVRIGGGFLEFGRKGAASRINLEEIKNLSLNGGVFTVQHQDARWYSSKGHYSFQYSTMGNARLFLIAVERLLGYRFG